MTPGRGSGARLALERTAESHSSGGGLLWGRRGVFPPLLSSRRQAESQKSVRGGQPVRPRRCKARPGSPGASQGGVIVPSARPRGMHRGSRRRRRHSQVSCGRTWREPRTLAPTQLPLSAVPGSWWWWQERRGGARRPCPASPLGSLPGPEAFREGLPESWVS